MSTETTIATRPEIDKELLSVDSSKNSGLLDTRKFWQAQKAAAYLATCTMIPEHFQGKSANCFIALQLANRLEIDVFALMQKLYIVHGKPGLEAQMLIAMANARGPFKGRIGYRLEGDGMGRKCTAHATLADTGEVVEATVDMAMAKRMGWLDKKDSMWQKMPDQMLCYRSATFLVRLICPEVTMGLHTREELVEMAVPASESGTQIMDQLDALTVESKPVPEPDPALVNSEAALISVAHRNQYFEELREATTVAACESLRDHAADNPELQDDDHEEVVMACNKKAAELGRAARGKKANGELFESEHTDATAEGF